MCARSTPRVPSIGRPCLLRVFSDHSFKYTTARRSSIKSMYFIKYNGASLLLSLLVFKLKQKWRDISWTKDLLSLTHFCAPTCLLTGDQNKQTHSFLHVLAHESSHVGTQKCVGLKRSIQKLFCTLRVSVLHAIPPTSCIHLRKMYLRQSHLVSPD